MELLISVIKPLTAVFILLQLLPLVIWIERKGAAYFQDRRGPNRASLFGVIRMGGMIHALADAIKLLTKEEFFPQGASRFYFVLAPFITMFIYFVTIAVVPFADTLQIGNFVLSFQVADLNVGLLYIFAMSSLAVYGIVLAGWASNNKYSFLGGLRASSQMISYEMTLALAVVSLFMVAGTVDLNEIIRNQGSGIISWNVFHQPLAFILFVIASFAETNRTPFDLPEGESELVAGYHTEYSSMKFALFYMGEYTAIIVSSAVIVSLFFGGWQVPFLPTEALISGAEFHLTNFTFGFSILSILAGIFLVAKFRRRFHDARDFEVLIFGLPALLVGGGLLGFVITHSFYPLPEWAPPVFAAAVQCVCFLTKVLLFCFVFVWTRWTLPRFRYDQLMSFGWKGMLPLALFNIMVTGVVLLWI